MSSRMSQNKNGFSRNIRIEDALLRRPNLLLRKNEVTQKTRLEDLILKRRSTCQSLPKTALVASDIMNAHAILRTPTAKRSVVNRKNLKRCSLSPLFFNIGTTDETFQQTDKQFSSNTY